MSLSSLTLAISAMVLFGCASMRVANKQAQREFTYTYTIPGKTQSELWRNARNHFATVYGDFREVFSVMDEEDGIMIGKGLFSWSLLTTRCYSSYHIRFAAQDGKARLQYEIIEDVPPGSECTGWPWPSESAYNDMVDFFKATAQDLEEALKDGSELEDF